MVNTETRTRTTYKAAVYEHAVILPPDPLTPVSRTTAVNNMMKNLNIYQKQAEIAAKEVRYYSRPDRQIRRQHLLIFQPGYRVHVGMCAHRMLRSDCASVQSDLSFRCALFFLWRVNNHESLRSRMYVLCTWHWSEKSMSHYASWKREIFLLLTESVHIWHTGCLWCVDLGVKGPGQVHKELRALRSLFAPLLL